MEQSAASAQDYFRLFTPDAAASHSNPSRQLSSQPGEQEASCQEKYCEK
jgi:hypothetical protein